MSVNPNLINLYENLKHECLDFDQSKLMSNPVFIVATPRSGSSLLFEQLISLDDIWSIGSESHIIFKQFSHLQYENNNKDSACLNATHADDLTKHYFKFAFYYLLKNNQKSSLHNRAPQHAISGIFLEKTPRNALNIPFLKTVFPNARFIYLHREPRQNISSIIEVWNNGLQTNRFVTFFDLPDWPLKKWCLLLPKNWRSMKGKSIAEIAYFQWLHSNLKIINDLKKINKKNWTSIGYQDFITNPTHCLKKLLNFMSHDIEIDENKFKTLPMSKTVLNKPSENKWMKHKQQMHSFYPDLENQYQMILDFCQK